MDKDWEVIQEGHTEQFSRWRVDNGWIYKFVRRDDEGRLPDSIGMVFVPD